MGLLESARALKPGDQHYRCEKHGLRSVDHFSRAMVRSNSEWRQGENLIRRNPVPAYFALACTISQMEAFSWLLVEALPELFSRRLSLEGTV